MKLIILTGGIGSGKSTVAAMLNRPGARVIDSDALAHQIRDTLALQEIKGLLDPDILTPEGKIDRQKMAREIFKDPALLKKINAIIHPKIDRVVEERIAAGIREGLKALFVEMAFVVNPPWTKKVDEYGVVKVNRETALKRLSSRGVAEKEALSRMAVQVPPEDLIKDRPVILITNDGTLEELSNTVEKLWQQKIE